jgi:hypothetical protein
MMDSSFREMLRRWGFRPVNESGQPKAVDSAPTPQPKDSEETRKLAQKILTIPDVKPIGSSGQFSCERFWTEPIQGVGSR